MRKLSQQTILSIEARVMTCADCKFFNPFQVRECAFFNQNVKHSDPICLAGHKQIEIEKGE
jgi:hypothetical protein